MPRSIRFENIENFRDLGGYACSFGVTSFGNIYRSANVANASPADLDKVAELGIKTVIDLRGSEDQVKVPSAFKKDPRFTVIELEVNGNGRISVDKEGYYNSYLEMLEDPESARRILRTFITAEKPLVFHCNAGKDRTGVFSILLLALAGVNLEDINADYMLSFPYLPKMTKETREKRPHVPELLLTPDIEMIPEFYSRFLARYGSPENYCEVIGLSEEEVDYLQNVLGKHHKSCGAVVFYKNKVLVEHMVKGHYSLPKGMPEEKDRNERATAKREIKEETGLDVAFVEGFRREINYSHKKGRVKKVVFFLAEAKSGKATPQKEEVSDIYFLSPPDAMLAVSYDSERKLIAEAAHYYSEH